MCPNLLNPGLSEESSHVLRGDVQSAIAKDRAAGRDHRDSGGFRGVGVLGLFPLESNPRPETTFTA